jgi:Putative phage serine protease XkdF
MADEQRYVLALAYQAGPDPKIKKGQDGRRDFFSVEELEKAAFSYAFNGMDNGLYHVDGTRAGTTVESYIYRGPDWRVSHSDGDVTVVKAGDWLVGAILNEHGWDLYKRGELTGWSPQGTARRLTRGRSG